MGARPDWPVICHTCKKSGVYGEGTLWSCKRCGGYRFMLATRTDWQDRMDTALRHLLGNKWKLKDYAHLIGLK